MIQMVKNKLKAEGRKQRWLADAVGVDEVTVSYWFSGKVKPTKSNMDKMLKVLKLNNNGAE